MLGSSRNMYRAAVVVLSQIFLVNQAWGHTLMQHPIPFPSQYKDNAPMNKDGSNWPCSGETEFKRDGYVNIWERGSTQELRAMGGASHGGGSCQISVTLDLKPTRESEWRVIHSIQGGCPIRNLTEVNYGDSPTVLLPDAYNFTVPEWLPVGPAVMAWTWFGRWSVPEVFMNCAPIMVQGGVKGIQVTEEARLEDFMRQPLIFEANNGNGCWTQNKGSCLKFPDPGESLVVNDECPIMEDEMLTGTCGPEYSLRNMGRLNRLFGRWPRNDLVNICLGAIALGTIFVLAKKLRKISHRYQRL